MKLPTASSDVKKFIAQANNGNIDRVKVKRATASIGFGIKQRQFVDNLLEASQLGSYTNLFKVAAEFFKRSVPDFPEYLDHSVLLFEKNSNDSDINSKLTYKQDEVYFYFKELKVYYEDRGFNLKIKSIIILVLLHFAKTNKVLNLKNM